MGQRLPASRTLPTKGLNGFVFVVFNGDKKYRDPKPDESKSMAFAGYYLELKAQDHPPLPGGGIQVGVVGSPQVLLLEEWNDSEDCWSTVLECSPVGLTSRLCKGPAEGDSQMKSE